jgi:hypothetical protein
MGPDPRQMPFQELIEPFPVTPAPFPQGNRRLRILASHDGADYTRLLAMHQSTRFLCTWSSRKNGERTQNPEWDSAYRGAAGKKPDICFPWFHF